MSTRDFREEASRTADSALSIIEQRIPEIKDIETNTKLVLLEVFATVINNWMITTASHLSNEEFYRDILDKCAEAIGLEAYTSDDGSIQHSPIRLKIPELIQSLKQEIQELKELIKLKESQDVIETKEIEKALKSLKVSMDANIMSSETMCYQNRFINLLTEACLKSGIKQSDIHAMKEKATNND